MRPIMKIPIARTTFGPAEFEAIQKPLSSGWVVQRREILTDLSAAIFGITVFKVNLVATFKFALLLA